MFEQFTKGLSGSQVYLISSMIVFVVFFVVVTVVLIRLKKQHINHMGQLPLEDSTLLNPSKSLQS